MINAFRWLLRIFLGIATLIAAVLGLGYYFAARSLPDYDEDFTVGGIDSPVEIVRDTADIPHIFAAGDAGVFFGLGFAHAQDRLWQMTVMRRTAQGRLSEIFGAQTLPTDDLMRRLDIYGAASASLAAQDDDTLAALKAYADGVNAWISLINSEAKGRGAPEFFLFSNEISYWQPVDSIALLKLMALKSSSQMTLEIRRARLSLLSSDWASDLMPEVPGNGVAALPPFASLVPGVRPSYAALSPAEAFSPVPQAAFAGASNAWAAAPARSVANGSLIANDPHVDFSAPGLFYLARLDLESGGVIGASIPGIPAILAGRNNGLGWAISGAWLDDQDIFIEELDPADGERYRTPQGWKPFVSRRSIIDVKDSPPVTITLRWSENGPILPGTHLDLASVTPPGHVAALSWTLFTGADTSLSATLKLMRARSVSEGIAAGESYVAPALNLVMVDAAHIGMKTVGRMPRRDAAHVTRGRMPAPGWEPENRWLGREAYAANPEFTDPVGGILGNTNNKILDRPFPLHVSYDWGDTQRVQRWSHMMQTRAVHTRESFIEAQLDDVSITARNLLPLVGADLWFTGDPAPEGTPERARQRALTLLADWNGEMNEHMPEPLIYMAWMRALQERLIRDELGPLAAAFTHPEPVFIERVFRDVDGAGVWCDIVQSAPVETCTEIAEAALDAALIWIDETYGGETEALRWGDAHQAMHDHPVLGEVPFIRWFMNIRQSTSGGDNTLNRGLTRGTGDNPMQSTHAAVYRGVYDFADPDSSLFITSTGQSGHFLSRHYDDLAQLWRRGEYVPMSLDEDLARAAAVGVTILTPRP